VRSANVMMEKTQSPCHFDSDVMKTPVIGVETAETLGRAYLPR
jgi:hypothetical protein